MRSGHIFTLHAGICSLTLAALLTALAGERPNPIFALEYSSSSDSSTTSSSESSSSTSSFDSSSSTSSSESSSSTSSSDSSSSDTSEFDCQNLIDDDGDSAIDCDDSDCDNDDACQDSEQNF